MKNMRNRRTLKPRRKAIKLQLDEEVFRLLEEDSERSRRNRQWQAEFLLENAIRASWAYECGPYDVPAVKAARDFFAELRDLQAGALKEIQRAGIAAEVAAREAAARCQHWLDAEKAHRTRALAGPKVIDGKFRPVQKGSAS